uniref:Uncharacterized protein n=1 Tax=Arion vulgaris TaxID=1028688 RepID=A0A0B7A992_9EUPU
MCKVLSCVMCRIQLLGQCRVRVHSDSVTESGDVETSFISSYQHQFIIPVGL